MKKVARYEIRYYTDGMYSLSIGRKNQGLRGYKQARKIAKRLKARGLDVFTHKVIIHI